MVGNLLQSFRGGRRYLLVAVFNPKS